ncbi:YD repeat domain protein, partial [Escherichia coli DEC3D]
MPTNTTTIANIVHQTADFRTCSQSQRINPPTRIRHIPVSLLPSLQPQWITHQVHPGFRLVISEPVIAQPRFCILPLSCIQQAGVGFRVPLPARVRVVCVCGQAECQPPQAGLSRPPDGFTFTVKEHQRTARQVVHRMIRSCHPLRGHGRVRLPYPAALLAYQLKAVKHQVPYAVQFIIAVFPDFRNTVAVPQVREADFLPVAAFLCSSAAGVVAVFPLLTLCAAIPGQLVPAVPPEPLCFRAIAVTVSGAADHPACGVIVILRVSGLFQPVASGILVSLFTYPV